MESFETPFKICGYPNILFWVNSVIMYPASQILSNKNFSFQLKIFENIRKLLAKVFLTTI